MARVSVVLIFLDAERFIEEAIESVLAQSLTDWELILVDDGSTDGSVAIAKRAADADPRTRYVEHPGRVNLGRSESRNVGAALASSPYLAFIDADDVWDRTKLAEQLDLLEREPDLAMVCGAMVYWHSWNPLAEKPDRLILTGGLSDRRLDPPQAVVQLYPLGSKDGAGVDVMIRRSIFQKVGGFEPRFRGLYDDQTLLVKVFLSFPVFFSARPWLLYRQHPDSCCATTLRSVAEYRRLRMDFLRWLGAYLGRVPTARPEVRRALRRARRRLRLEAARDMVKTPLRRLVGR